MPLRNKRSYEKKAPFRSSSLFVIVCEGEKREPQYFEFFDGLSSRIKVKIIPSIDGKSSPLHLLTNANLELNKIQFVEDDELWFVIDLDKWTSQIHQLQNECKDKVNWHIVISNPCFEVWLYYHFSSNKPSKEVNTCSDWKQLLNSIEPGGFDSGRHAQLIISATTRAKECHSETGYLPDYGCTQIFRLAEKIIPLVHRFLP